ncbi:MAG: hypothetical protein MK089_00885 [Phycisphaerales bacterium]|nr:hypothetical protein [Phycisphaerales bacterium]
MMQHPLVLLLAMQVGAADVLTPDIDEPMRGEFSLQAADAYLAEAAGNWNTTYKCVTCHTNGLYLISGAMEPAGKPWDDTRAFALEYLDGFMKGTSTRRGQYGAVEGVVATACFLAMGDSIRHGTLSPETRLALDYAILLQDEAGHWPDWLACNWPPYESDTHFGVTLMAIAIGRSPRDYQEQEHVKKAHARMESWLEQNPPETLHQKAMLIWAAAEGGIELAPASKEAWMLELSSLQQEDGGWSMSSLGNWPRRDGTAQLTSSEAYPTAFCIWVLRRGGMPTESDSIQQAVAWLKANQRESGRWFSRSQRVDSRHYLSNAATNMATIALRATAPSVIRRPFNRNATISIQSDGMDQSQ